MSKNIYIKPNSEVININSEQILEDYSIEPLPDSIHGIDNKNPVFETPNDTQINNSIWA